jgi:peptidoglycan/xylan/chitin deacetylase (PgdA/CDA1 family)
MYHRVGTVHDASERKYCMAPNTFAAHMHALAQGGYRAVAVEDFLAWLGGRAELPENAFVLTFDDGFLGVHDHAAPVLQQLGWPATVFLVTALLGGRAVWFEQNGHATCHPLLDREHIAAMAGEGFSFCSHSRHHADLTRLTDSELEDELSGSRNELNGLPGAIPDLLAYPYGRFDARVMDCARRAGYLAAFSVLSGFNRRDVDPFHIRRLDVLGTDTPTMLLRKIRLGSNDGSWRAGMYYMAGRLRQRLGSVS